QALAFHTLRRLGSAEVVLRLLAPRPPAPPVAALLHVALALLWHDDQEARYPEHTLVDQAVAAARQHAAHAAAFVNALLRRFLRERAAISARAEAEPLARFNHPPWWIDQVRADWPDCWQAVLAMANRQPPLTLRVNLRRGSVAAYLQRLAAVGLAARPDADVEGAILLERPVPVQQLPGFVEGAVSVQDASAQRAAPLLLGPGLPAGARVLDACAAPGGKTAHLLELADLELLALDIDAGRLARVEQNLQRLGLTATLRAGDALEPGQWWDGRPFAAILLDAPCTGSGVVRRHPDIRWLRRASDIEALGRRQAGLLDALWPTLSVGGRLLYCTCSLFHAEGQAQIDAFLQRRQDAVVASSPASPGQLLPLSDNRGEPPAVASSTAADAFFFTLLEKRPPP
ncbi:MAG: 16S rRNA (cytosine(967)-C(5))-methyltransferase RsmB, partial [Pseudomonadota bacterium]|nr:16S rRNA (cytosine(967)-C(5))-methyltransferase RsmB [Pseudomonadota bacterium]